MADNFTPRLLSMAVNMMKPVKTPILDKVFGKKKRVLTSTFSWDVKTRSDTLMSSISTSDEASVTSGSGLTEVSCRAPRYAEKRIITAGDLADMRKFGDASAPALLSERVADEQADLRAKCDLTREFQAVKALQGLVVDKDGKQLVDYKFPAAMKPVLSDTGLWSDDASSPITNIRAWKKLISRNSGGTISNWVAYCGSGAMDALIENPSVLEKLQFTLGRQIAEEGRIARLVNVSIEEYDGSYTDDAGTVHDLIPNDVFCLVGLCQDGAAEMFAPVLDLDAPAGVGKGKVADVFFSKMWDVQDPSGKWIKVESRPLPILTRLIVVWATVI